MKKALPKLRSCIVCGKLFEPQHEKDYTHPECLEEWNRHFRELKAKLKEKEENEGI